MMMTKKKMMSFDFFFFVTFSVDSFLLFYTIYDVPNLPHIYNQVPQMHNLLTGWWQWLVESALC